MAVVRIGYLRMVSLSQTATERAANVQHIVKEILGPPRKAGWNQKLAHDQLGVSVQAQCGTTFMGAIMGSRWTPQWGGLPVYWSQQPTRPCSKCHPTPELDMYVGIEQPWRLGPASAGELI